MSLCATLLAEGSRLCTLHINVKEARNIPLPRKASASLYVKCYLLPVRSASSKRKTKRIASQQNSPLVWEEELCYERLNWRRLAQHRSLEISLWSHNRGSNEMVAQFYLGSSDEDAKRYWENLFKEPGQWITCCCKVKTQKK